MAINIKKRLKIKNRTKYFSPDTTKVYNQFVSPSAYQSRQSKIEGYENRLYWEFRYCDEHNGSTFFYTLTYNDKHIPKYMGQNCFDYEDLRSLTVGAFAKYLLRHYGAKFKYFIGAELGDGKGERGMHNNPHYHVLFFVRDAENPRYPYKSISPEEFRHLVRIYWQGFDQDEEFVPFEDAKYGIAREGDNCGLVHDFRACMYCAKYVTKDVALKKHEQKIEYHLRCKYLKDIKSTSEVRIGFFKDVINPTYNIPVSCSLDENKVYQWTPEELFSTICPKSYMLYSVTHTPGSEPDLACMANYAISECGLSKAFDEYVKNYVDDKVHLALTNYRNRYCNKCRISQGVGDYALEHIENKMEPRIQVPSKNGFKQRPIGMYYYRKLFTEVRETPYGDKVRVLSPLGIEYKMSKIKDNIEKLAQAAEVNLSVITPELFETMRMSDINDSVWMHYSDFRSQINRLNKNKLIQRYAEYKLVYEDRFFKVSDNGFPSIDVMSDYHDFITPIVDKVPQSEFALTLFLEDDNQGYLPYYSHPYFLPYLRIFDVLDLLADYFFVTSDDCLQKQAESIAETKRFFNQQKVKNFYSQLR